MASDTIFNDLWEIAQKNSSEEIDKKSFKDDLSNSIYAELKKFSEEQSNINDEFSRALSVILSKAKVSPQVLGETKGGTFKVSSEIVVMAVKSVKYENQFIEGTPEYEKMQSNKQLDTGIKEIILTAIIIDKMIDNYTELTYDEKQKLIANYTNMTENEQQAMLKKVASGLKSHEKEARDNGNIKDADMYQTTREIVEGITDIKEMLSSENVEDQERARQILSQDEGFTKFLQDSGTSKKISIEGLLKKFNEYTESESKNCANIENLGAYKERLDGAIKDFEKGKSTITKIRKIMEENSKLFESFLIKHRLEKKDITIDDIENYYEFISEEQYKYHKELTQSDLTKLVNEQLSKTDGNTFYEKDEAATIAADIGANFEALIQNSVNIVDDENGKESVKGKSGQKNEFEKHDNKKVIETYTNYFQNLDDDDLKYLFEEVEKEDFVDTLNQELSSIEDKETLNLMINATYSARELLKNPQNREEFFSKMGKIVEEMNQRGNMQLIKDEEMQEIFKQAGVELQVGEFEQVREEDARQEVNGSNESPIDEIEARKEFLENHENFEIDSVWEEICRDAQDKGEVLEGKTLQALYERYKLEIELSEDGKVNAPEDRGEKAGNEEEQGHPDLLVTEEVKIAQNPQELSLDEQDGNEISDEYSEESKKDNRTERFGKKGKNERVAVIEKDENGNVTNIQVFRPIAFAKIANVGLEEIKEEQRTIRDLTQLMDKQLNGESLENGNSAKEDSRE